MESFDTNVAIVSNWWVNTTWFHIMLFFVGLYAFCAVGLLVFDYRSWKYIHEAKRKQEKNACGEAPWKAYDEKKHQ